MKTVYKLVKRVDDKLVSIKTKGLGQVVYTLNKWSQSPEHLRDKNYNLCVLKKLKVAIYVQSKYEKDSIILKCEAKDVYDTDKLPYLSSDDLSNGTFSSEDENLKWPSMCKVMAKKIRPIKEIT